MMDSRRKKLLYRAMHRGFKEADIVLGTFAKENLQVMSEQDLDQFEWLLEVPDRELYSWIIGEILNPPNYDCEMLERLKAFPLSDYVLDGAGK
ncbi:MAG: succinate dehydrogenase assembly factor 2 [Aquisalinus sp.]|nr:succinate dehydrogenase assembly factor 2 [Aquisalinus sp.]